MKKTKWKLISDKYPSKELLDYAGDEIIAKLLINRNIDTVKKAEAFLNPQKQELTSAFAFKHMQKCVDRVKSAIETKEHIIIYGDFDCDGVTSTSLLYKALKFLNANVSYYIPDRQKEGHGLNTGAICKLISKYQAKLIITVDCGVSNLSEVSLASGFGCDVIITDHHEAPEFLPQAYAILNPKVPDSLDENLSAQEIEYLNYLAGVGVAYKFASALLENIKDERVLKELLGLVAIGTVADVVPLIGENRALVQKGVDAIKELQPLGIKTLLESANVDINSMDAMTIAFSIAPRINASGRIDTAKNAVELLVQNDIDEIEKNVKILNQHNRVRQELCETTFLEAYAKVEREIDLNKNKGIVLFDKNWHPGVIGIVASKLVENFHKPVFMMTLDEDEKTIRCSARSIEGLHLYNTLLEIEDLLGHFGGHAFAAGFSFDLEKTQLKDFVPALNKLINETLEDKFLIPVLKIDDKVDFQKLDVDLMEKIQRFAPFGQGNHNAVFASSKVFLQSQNTIGANNNHLKAFFEDENKNTLETVWWNKKGLNMQEGDEAKIAFTPYLNNFNGKISIQLELKDVLPLNVKKEGLKFVDHRSKENIEKLLDDYLKTAKSKTYIYIENKKSIERIKNYPNLSKNVFDRQTLQPCDQIVFFDLPSSREMLMQIIEKTAPKIVHITKFQKSCHQDAIETIKTISGMLKYAHSNYDGVIDLPKISSLLNTSDEIVKGSIRLLKVLNVIKINGFDDNELKFDYIKTQNIGNFSNENAYIYIEKEIAKVKEFHQLLFNGELDEIRTLTMQSQ